MQINMIMAEAIVTKFKFVVMDEYLCRDARSYDKQKLVTHG